MRGPSKQEFEDVCMVLPLDAREQKLRVRSQKGPARPLAREEASVN